MSKFKILLARQAGEKLAHERGFHTFPIDPIKIASQEEIEIVAKPPDKKGVSGGIFFHENDVTIFYATDIDNDGFKRFTIGHELGHYFLPGHPEEIQKSAPIHLSRAGFSEGAQSIEIEADHFASGLLMPSKLVQGVLDNKPIGLNGIIALANEAECSITASAIRSAECSSYPMAIIVSKADKISYGFLSNGFKRLKPGGFPRKGLPLPNTMTRTFNGNPAQVQVCKRVCGKTSMSDWFRGERDISLDEEVIGLGRYGFTLTVLSSEELPEDPTEYDNEEGKLIDSWTPRFAYGR